MECEVGQFRYCSRYGLRFTVDGPARTAVYSVPMYYVLCTYILHHPSIAHIVCCVL